MSMSIKIKCRVCGTEKPREEIVFGMHCNREYSFCSSECMRAFYNPAPNPEEKTRKEKERRIAACVNALAGYTTEEIEQLSIKRIEEENQRLKSILENGWHLEQQAIQSIRDATDELSFDERNELVLSVGWIAGEDGAPAEYGLRMSLYEYAEEGAEMLATMTPPDTE